MTAKLVAFVAQQLRHLAKYVLTRNIVPFGHILPGKSASFTLKKQKAQENEGRQGLGTRADELMLREARNLKTDNNSTATSLILAVILQLIVVNSLENIKKGKQNW